MEDLLVEDSEGVCSYGGRGGGGFLAGPSVKEEALSRLIFP